MTETLNFDWEAQKWSQGTVTFVEITKYLKWSFLKDIFFPRQILGVAIVILPTLIFNWETQKCCNKLEIFYVVVSHQTKIILEKQLFSKNNWWVTYSFASIWEKNTKNCCKLNYHNLAYFGQTLKKN